MKFLGHVALATGLLVWLLAGEVANADELTELKFSRAELVAK